MCASSGNTLPVSLAAIVNRGEWKISMMFEVYLSFSEPGYQYLAQILARLMLNYADFSVIPPQFICGMKNEFLGGAMNSCFKLIINDGGRSGDGVSLRSNTKSLFIRCLACMVYHADALR